MLLFFLFAAMSAPPAHGEMSLQRAIQLVQDGIGSDPAAQLESWKASRRLLEASLGRPQDIVPVKDAIVAEIRKLDAWDSFTEVTGTYKLNLIKSLFSQADPELSELFVSECRHGTFSAKGLAAIGAPAIPTLLKDLDRHSTCRLAALTAIAETWLGPGAATEAGKDELIEQYRNRVIPAIERRIEKIKREAGPSPAGPPKTDLEKAREALSSLSELVDESG